jgi:hypothetical protein
VQNVRSTFDSPIHSVSLSSVQRKMDTEAAGEDRCVLKSTTCKMRM